ncbi:hypothetical protein [Pseudomonas putida]|uniref:hypothetical protein n=1 Tax=Pseudomonas putida TaxID=303 RepID=UPI0013A6D9E7|nr:hypothetical protein [Pseudomonas putida]
MKLDEVEIFALEHLFNLDNAGVAHQTVNADHYRVQERAVTTAGFFSIIKCLQASQPVQPLREICKPFTHPRLRRGGVFICWIESDLSLCLEGVAEQRNWPMELMPLSLQHPRKSPADQAGLFAGVAVKRMS